MHRPCSRHHNSREVVWQMYGSGNHSSFSLGILICASVQASGRRWKACLRPTHRPDRRGHRNPHPGQIIRTDERKKRPRRSFRHIGNKCYRGARHRRAGYPRCHRKNRRRGRRASRQHFSDSRYCLIVVSSKFRHCK